MFIIFLKKCVASENESETLTKKLMNFISNDIGGKEMVKNSNYDTILGREGKGKQSGKSKNSGDPQININISNNVNINVNTDLNQSDSLSHYLDKESNERLEKLIRFAGDYCRASPNISLKSKTILNIGWRVQKFNYDVEYEMTDFKGDKQTMRSVMTAIPINKSLLKFEDDFIRDNYSKVIQNITQNHKNLLPFYHFDILPSQKLMIKIHRFNEYGSVKDLLYKSYPLNSYSKKYPQNGKGLHLSLVASYSRQILEALHYLHSNRWFHLHLHTGNILLEDDGSTVKIAELENFVNNLPIRNEHYFNYAYENFNSDHYLNAKNDFNSSVLTEIFKNNFNIFEKIDVISFGRVLYEMTTGKELKAPFPDPLEYKEMDREIVDVLKLIFNKKVSKVNNNYTMTVPDVTAADLLKLKVFAVEQSSDKEESSIVLSNSQNQIKSTFEIEHNVFLGDFDNYCSFIKENLFNQAKFLKAKLKSINSYVNKF